ncbi:MAG: glycosyltransferase [Thermoflexales bacterium]
MREINQIVPRLAHADAVGNQVVEIRNWLVAAGFESRVITLEWDARFADYCVHPDNYKDGPSKLTLFHHCVGSGISDLALTLKGRVIPYYHNVTPARFYSRYGPNFAGYLEMGRAQLRQHAAAPYALAASEYNRLEMLEVGYKQVEVLPYVIGLDRLRLTVDCPAAMDVVRRLDDGLVTWLFVGRVAPNKRQDSVIRAFNYYHRLINPRSRLVFVGGFDLSSPEYAEMLRTLVGELRLTGSVEFSGSISPEAGLAGYYQAADVFVCLSEHEGFCIPLIEAMQFDTPVLALNSSGVPYALGNAGVLVAESRPDVVAEAAHLLISDDGLRQQTLAHQRQRRMMFEPDIARARLGEVVGRLAAGSLNSSDRK